MEHFASENLSQERSKKGTKRQLKFPAQVMSLGSTAVKNESVFGQKWNQNSRDIDLQLYY